MSRSPVCEFSAENINCSQLVTDAHLMVRDNLRAIFEAGILTNQNPRLAKNIEKIKIALKLKKKVSRFNFNFLIIFQVFSVT